MHLALMLLALATVVAAGGDRTRQRQPRIAIASAGAALACAVYIHWRDVSVAGFAPAIGGEAIWTWTFLAIEIACAADLAISLLMLSRATDRRAEAARHERRLRGLDPGTLPAVDVWIATYNEEREIVEKTVVAAQAIDWPRHKLRIWVLDDGKRDWLRAFCDRRGVEYVVRPGNAGRKAGNHNHALGFTHAPFILSLDADFVPFPSILYRLMGFFDDARVAIVQSPQSYYNVEPMRQNLLLQRDIPDELDPFYRVIQPARDAWDAAFYVGSCAVIRRAAILDIGGFETRTDIEDQVTSIRLLAGGWVTRFVNETLSIGLHPESNHAYHDQRNRWCRGSLQILFMPYGPFGRGLGLVHRLFFAQTYWLVANVGTLAFALTPALIWLFGWRIFPANEPLDVLLMPILYYLAIALYLNWRGRGYIVPVVWHGFQLFQAVTLLPVVLTTLLKPFGRSLIAILPVTPKGRLATDGRVDWPTFTVLGLMLAAMIGGILQASLSTRVFLFHAEEMAALIAWTIYAGAVILVALSCCLSLGYRRGEERFDAAHPGAVVGLEHRAVTLRDLSLTGARIAVGGGTLPPAGLVTPRGGPVNLPFRVVRAFGGGEFGVAFVHLDEEQRAGLTRLIFQEIAPKRPAHEVRFRKALAGVWRAMVET